MRASEVLRWCYRHQCNLEFKSVQEGVALVVNTHKKKLYTLLLRNHDTVADDVCRFIEKISKDINLE